VIFGSALGLIEKAVEFTAGRIEGALLLFRAVVDQWAAVGAPTASRISFSAGTFLRAGV
jgi:hypothetical protein